MIIPEGKERLVFKMRHENTFPAEVVCTESFIGQWQGMGYSLVGYVIAEEGEYALKQIKVEHIPDNMWQDVLTSTNTNITAN